MLRRGSLIVVLALSIAGCKGNGGGALTGATQSRAPAADAVLVFVSGSWSSDLGQPRELFSANLDASRVDRLTGCAELAQPCDILQVAFAPDRARIAAVRTTPGASRGAAGLYFMDLSRSVEKLLFARRQVSAVDWSPDSSFLIYSSTGDGLATTEATEDLYYCMPNGTSDQTLTSTAAIRERAPRISPAATTAIFEQIDDTGVAHIALYGQPPVAITSGPATGPALPGTPYVVGADADPVFSPDSKSVAFRRLTGIGNGGLGTWDLMSVGSDGTNPQPILTGGGVFRGAPDWGTSGIVFVETDAAAGSSRLVVVQPDGSGRTVLREENSGYQMGAPRWLPGS
jgi:Tol biopolymer transport system component